MSNTHEGVCIAEGVIGEILDSEAVLLDTRSGRYYRLNRTGTRLWQALEQGGALKNAVETLANEFDMPREVVERDVRRWVEKLEESELLVAAS